MIKKDYFQTLATQLEALKSEGLYKTERLITTPQSSHIETNSKTVLNFCANNYLGLSNHAKVVAGAKAALERYGYGLSSVRFICGTQDIHKKLESELSAFLQLEDTILYSSCFDANGGLFETLFSEDDAIISDSLNHASIIDGIRLSKAKRLRYNNNNLNQLEQLLKDSQNCRMRVIATDGVFSMDGIIANLKGICDLADTYNALVMVDDSHAVGFMGENGRGTPEHCGVMGRVDIITGTLGKALGGASGGYTSGKREIIEWLRQRSRPYLFSNSLAPMITQTTLEVLALLKESKSLLNNLRKNTQLFRTRMQALGFDLVPGEHPIIPVMLGDAKLATEFADALLQEGIFVIGFSFPVVPKGKARIRTQISAAHSTQDIEKAIGAFEKVGKKLGVIS